MTAPFSIMDAAAVVGLGQTDFGKGLGQSEEALGVAAIKAALDDAGIAPGEVDGLCSYAMQVNDESEIARDLGLGDLRFFTRTPAGGGGGCATVAHAAMAIAAGQASVVVAWRARKRSARSSRLWVQTSERVDRREMWTRPFGLVRPADELAMLARRHMHEFGTTRDHFANVALACRHHALLNPAAVMHGRPLTREDYFNARAISEPLVLFDCCLETDGAAAVVLVSAERARDCRQRPAFVHSAAQGVTRGSMSMGSYYNEDPLHTQAWACAAALWARSDFKAKDVKVAQIYDAFSPEVLFSLEAYGFCARGESGPFTDDGAIELGGRLPINTSGGGLSEVYLHGFNLILEGVRQIRGTSTAQVPQADCSFISSSDGVPTSAILLRG